MICCYNFIKLMNFGGCMGLIPGIRNLMTQDLSNNFFVTKELKLEKKNCWTRFVRWFIHPSKFNKFQVVIAIEGCVTSENVQSLNLKQKQS